MPKTYTRLWGRVASFGALLRAHRKARRGHSRAVEVLRFEMDLEDNLFAIVEALNTRTWRTGPYRYLFVRDPKPRQVVAVPYSNRVVHHALVSVLEEIYEPRFIYDSYACRKGKGVHAGVARALKFIRAVSRKGPVYALKADVAQYFASIDRDRLLALLSRYVADPDVLWLCEEIACSYPGPGLPLGNLTSQLWGNVYLHELDLFVKQTLRERYYIRYMDDFVILSNDKAHLHRLRREIETFLRDRLGLRLHPKTQVFPVRERYGRPLDFLGYRIYPDRVLLRKRTVLRIRRALRALSRKAEGHPDLAARLRRTANSYLGLVKHSANHNLYAWVAQFLTDSVIELGEI